MTTDRALGVLGGMGPAATADFLQRLARLTPATRDQEHLPTIVYSDPRTPDRSDAILQQGPSPLPAMRHGIEFLNRAGCALIAIPCNSAHFWYEELASHSDVPVLHIADATAERLRTLPGLRSAGVMATDGTLHAEIFQTRLRDAGIAALCPADRSPGNPVMRGIRCMKAGDPAGAQELLVAGAQALITQGADALVIGCTDISAALAGIDEIDSVPLLDAADCLAYAAIGKLTPEQ